MFTDCTSSSEELLISEVDCLSLAYFVRAFHHQPIETSFNAGLRWKAINLLIRFECQLIARRMLYEDVKDLPEDEIFDAFELASQLNDKNSACRIIAQGWRAETSSEKSLLPDRRAMDVHRQVDEDDGRIWTSVDAAKIQSSWLWALALAQTACLNKMTIVDAEGKDFWRMMVGEFMTNLVDAIW